MEALKTKREKQKEKLHGDVCNTYTVMREMYATAKPSRVMNAVADKYSITPMWVRNILIRNGLYHPKRHEKIS